MTPSEIEPTTCRI